MIINRSACIFLCTIFFILSIMVPFRKSDAGDDLLYSLLPPSDSIENWKWEETPLIYQPGNLFEYINGSADLYLSYDFQRLITVGFINSDDESVVIDIYDMSTPLNAFGVYSVYRNPNSQIEAIGTEAIVSEYHIRFYKDRYVVDLNASDMTDEIQQTMHKLAHSVAKKITGAGSKLREIDLLPTENLIPKSIKYISNGLLGHKFLSRGLEGQYEINEHTVKAFTSICESSLDAEKQYQNFIQYLRNAGKTPTNWPELGQAAFSGEMPYHQYGLICRLNRFIMGVIDLPDPQIGENLIKAMLRQVESDGL